MSLAKSLLTARSAVAGRDGINSDPVDQYGSSHHELRNRDQRHGRLSHQTQIIKDVPQCDAGSLVLRHAAERRPAAQPDIHQHFRRSINDRQSASAI
jgi:hypothetical protein